MTRFLSRRYLWPLVLLASLASLLSISYRFRMESRNKAASLAAEIENIETLAQAEGKPLDIAIEDLKRQGLRGLVLTEETFGDLLSQHEVEVGPGPILRGTPSTLLRVQHAILRRFADPHIRLSPDRLDLSDPAAPSLASLKLLSVGLDPKEALAARNSGLLIIGRYSNPIGATSRYVTLTLATARAQGVKVFLPLGDQVLGRREATKTLIEALHENSLLYASPEFAKLGGDTEVLKMAPEIVVRLHSALSAELDKLPEAEAVDRYARAARERNQRILLVRPLSLSGERPLEDFGGYLAKITREIRRQGGDIGIARPFNEPPVPKLLFLLIGVLAAPLVYLASVAVLGDTMLSRGVGAIAVLLAVACYSSHLRPYMALAAAIATPILAFDVLSRDKRPNLWRSYLETTLISLSGGLVVAGLLNGLPYAIRAEEFLGVKVAVFVPIAVAGVLLYSRLTDSRSAFSSAITWNRAALTLGLLALAAFMISRTGNDNPAGVSGTELKLRSLLDAILFVRPRTKEFLVGHPMLFVGIGMLGLIRSGRKLPSGFAGWTALALTVGAVGQTDVVNTMCHFHTPIALSFARIAIGWLAGGILGSILWALVRVWIDRAGGVPPLSEATNSVGS